MSQAVAAFRFAAVVFKIPCLLDLKWNPCSCGFYGDTNRKCRCSVRQIENYRQRISGLLLDSIDIHVEVPLADFKDLTSDVVAVESSAMISQRVANARSIQVDRFNKAKLITNSAIGVREVREHCELASESKGYLEQAMAEINFSARAHDGILQRESRSASIRMQANKWKSYSLTPSTDPKG